MKDAMNELRAPHRSSAAINQAARQVAPGSEGGTVSELLIERFLRSDREAGLELMRLRRLANFGGGLFDEDQRDLHPNR
jgi:hypothetical protein